MGLYDREYYRDEYARRERWQFGPITIALAIATTAPFFAQMALARRDEESFWFTDPLMQAGGFVLEKILNGEVWRIITSVFLHDVNLGTSIWLLGGGVMVLLFCGRSVEGTYGPKEVFWFYLATILVTQLALFAVSIARPFGFVAPNPGYGSAGPTTAILVLFACLSRDAPVPVIFTTIRAGHLATGVILINMLLFVSSRYQYAPAIPILAGAAFAFAYHRFSWRISNWIPDLPGLRGQAQRSSVKSRPLFQHTTDAEATDEMERPTPKPIANVRPKSNSEVARPIAAAVDEQLEAQVDNVLAKMSKYGRESLTEQEQQLLKRASEIYKKRRS